MRGKHIIIIERVITSRQHTLERAGAIRAKNVEFLAHKHRKHTESSPHRQVNSYFILLFLYFANSTASHSWNICKGWEWRRIMIFIMDLLLPTLLNISCVKLYLSSSCDCKLPRFCCIRSLCVFSLLEADLEEICGEIFYELFPYDCCWHTQSTHTLCLYMQERQAQPRVCF